MLSSPWSLPFFLLFLDKHFSLRLCKTNQYSVLQGSYWSNFDCDCPFHTVNSVNVKTYHSESRKKCKAEKCNNRSSDSLPDSLINNFKWQIENRQIWNNPLFGIGFGLELELASGFHPVQTEGSFLTLAWQYPSWSFKVAQKSSSDFRRTGYRNTTGRNPISYLILNTKFCLCLMFLTVPNIAIVVCQTPFSTFMRAYAFYLLLFLNTGQFLWTYCICIFNEDFTI